MINTLLLRTIRCICVAVFGGVVFCVAQEAASKHGRPVEYDLMAIVNNNFLQHECRDYRYLLLSREAILSMEDRSVCYFCFLGYSLKKAEPGTKSIEIAIKGNKTVRDILNTAGMSKWRSGQPQIRVISRCSIVQSPLMGKMIESEENDTLLRYQVKPGDIIIVTRVQ